MLWKHCHGYPHNSANGPCLATLHCMQLTQPCSFHHALLLLHTTLISKCLSEMLVNLFALWEEIIAALVLQMEKWQQTHFPGITLWDEWCSQD